MLGDNVLRPIGRAHAVLRAIGRVLPVVAFEWTHIRPVVVCVRLDAPAGGIGCAECDSPTPLLSHHLRLTHTHQKTKTSFR